MKLKFFKRKTAKISEKELEADAFVHRNMNKARKVDRNVDPVTIIKDSFHNAKKPKNINK